jgi:acyl-CoA thioesterase-1
MRKTLLLIALLLPAAAVFASPAAQTILVLGDSLSAGYGIARQDAWPSLLEARLKDSGYSHAVVNASISGETTSGGRTRLPELLKQQPKVVIIELGANDGLRGLPVATTKDNLQAMIKLSQQAGARVLLVGMRLPANYGRDYTEKFAASYTELAKAHKTALVPFLFEGFAERSDAFQPDRLHPTAASQPLMLDTIWKQLKPLLR